MGLRFSGAQRQTDAGVSIEAFDGAKRVVVQTSNEAIEDYGLAVVKNKAAEKYDAGNLTADGFVQVLTADL